MKFENEIWAKKPRTTAVYLVSTQVVSNENADLRDVSWVDVPLIIDIYL